MLIRRRRAFAGFSLIELMITLAVIAVVMMVGLPNVQAWIQNTQLRTASEGLVSGLQMARAEALRRNANVRFQLVTTLDNTCALPAAGATTGANWVVSLGDATGACDQLPSEAVDPKILQKKSGAEGSLNAKLAADGPLLVFNGLGRPATGAANLTQINIRNPNGGQCQPTGEMRCLSILVSTGGGVRMCDPSVADAADSRSCGAGFTFVP